MGTAAKTYSRACQSGFRYRNGKCVPSFEALVASVTTDVRPRAVLDDWIAQVGGKR